MFKKSKYYCNNCKRKTNHYLILDETEKCMVFKCNQCGKRKIHSYLLKVRTPILILMLFLIGCHSPPDKIIPTFEIKAKFLDEYNNPISVNYTLDIYNNVTNSWNTIKTGYSGNSYTIISEKQEVGQIYSVSYFNSEHYPKKEVIDTNADYLRELSFGSNDRKAKINLSFEGILGYDMENEVYLDVNLTNGSIRGLSLCFDYSLRIIYAKLKSEYIMCDTSWVNYSYAPRNVKYDLTNNLNRCISDGTLVNCDYIDRYKCKPKDIMVPDQLKKKASKCYYLGKDLTSDYRIPLLVKTMPIRMPSDYLTIYLIDEENNMFNATLLW